MALGDLVLALCQLPAGLFADRCGRRASMALGSLAQLAGILGLWLGKGLPVLTLASMAIGIGDAFRDGADEALLHDSLEQLARSEEFGSLVARARQRAQFVLVVLVLGGGWMATRFGFTWVWIAEAALAAIGLTVALCMKEVGPIPVQETSEMPSLREALPPWRFIFPSLALVTMASATSFGVEAGWKGAAFPLTVVVALTILGEGLGAGLSANRRYSLGFSLGFVHLCLVGLLLVTWAPTTWLWATAVGVSVLSSFGQGVAEPIRAAMIQQWAPPQLRATAASAAYTCDMLLQTLGLCLFGYLLQSWGLASAYLGLAMLVLLLALSGQIAKRRHGRR